MTRTHDFSAWLNGFRRQVVLKASRPLTVLTAVNHLTAGRWEPRPAPPPVEDLLFARPTTTVGTRGGDSWTVRASIERLLSPSLGTCFRCNRPWVFPAQRRVGPRTWQQLNRMRFFGLVGVVEHQTPYKREHGNFGCFPLCEGCWSRLTPSERLPYYDTLVDRWKAQAPDHAADYEADRQLIRRAVLNGR